MNQEIDKTETDESSKKPAGRWHWLKTSYAVWALLAILSVDVFCKLNWQGLKLDHYASPNRSMVWWTVDDFRKQSKSPELVLLGSSLLMHALHGGDAEYLKLPQNEVYHHKAAMLEDLIKKKTGANVDTFAFALAGQMASDAYALSSTLFKGEHKPKLIVYSIAPRDLMDNTLGSPASTEIFRFMSKVGGGGADMNRVAWQARTGLWEKVEYMVENASSIYDHRNYFVYLQQKYAKSLLKVIGYKPTDEVHTPFALRRLALLELPEDIGSNERIALPDLDANYTDNSDEYRKRYQPFKQKPYAVQLGYLEKFLSYCKQEDIDVVFVNMPLTEDNIKLMPPGAYDMYKKDVTSLATKYQKQFIDLQDSKTYDKSLYCDTAHMTGKGGLKFFSQLADKLTDGSSLAFRKNGSWQ